ncbi:O-Glycosyl hydrolase [Paenibacillus catalpae]|uniref:O-Glycosyl hydrolase n=1 Tax=Paenibacillus catalpae TaxID=1045775 RepID=A0A1I1TCF8_9BACL|nr:glycoside hydrolase [Paenibacillus catalpae]SFD53150.1 O-Glycosyl hydrolase [Paenibacillus catalpae]
MKPFKLKKSTAAAMLGTVISLTSFGSPTFAAEAVKPAVTYDAVINVDASTTFQEIDNFGASDAWSMEQLGKNWTEANKSRVADLLFSRDKGIGLTAWRFNIGAGSTETDKTIITDPWRRVETFKASEDSDYDWSKQAGQQWFLKAAKDRGVDTLIGFVNSPPVWMTKNGHAQPDAAVGSTNLKEGYEDEFAAFLTDVIEHFKKQGINLNYISPINEPTWDWNKAGQEGNRYNNDDIKRVILELYSQLKAKGLNSQISAPDGVEITALLDDEVFKSFSGQEKYMGGSNSLGVGKYREYIKDLLGDPELQEAVGHHIASHSYWSDYSNPGDDRLGTLRDLLFSNLNKYDREAVYWVSEYCILGDYGPGRDLGIDPALHIAKTIHFDLARANASAWQWWTAVSAGDYKDGLIYTDYHNPGDEQNILTSKMFWTLGNYSKFIRPGAERVALTGLDEDARNGALLGSAYKHDGENTVTTVFVNDSSKEQHIKVELSGIDNHEAIHVLKPYVTSADQDLERGADIPASADGSFDAVIPARSIVTLNGDVVKENKKPDAPQILKVEPLNKGLKVDFKAPKGAYNYEVEYGFKNSKKVLKLSNMSADSFVLQGLQNNASYYVTIRAANDNGFGPTSKRAYGTPELLAPAVVKAAGTDGGFTITYNTQIGVPAYRVRYGTQQGKYDTQYVTQETSGKIQINGLMNGKVYYGVIEAVDGKNTSKPTAEFKVQPNIAAPGKLIAIPGNGEALLTFGSVEGAVGYTVQTTLNNNVQQISGNKTVLTGLTNGKAVTIRVSTVGKGGKGTGYAETSVTPANGEVRFKDDFTSGALTGYSQDVSKWVIEDGLLKHASGGNNRGEIGVNNLTVIDGTITAVAKHALGEADWGVTFRGSSYSKGYMFGYENGILVLRRDGQNLADPVPFSAKLGEYYNMEVRLNGQHIQAYLDGTLIFDVKDTMYTSGRVGLHSWADAQFAYLQAARNPENLTAAPEIYQIKEGDGQVVLHYREVDGAGSYLIRYAAKNGGTVTEVAAASGSSVVTGLQNNTAYSFKVVAVRGTVETESAPMDATPNSNNSVVYYVDAGDGTPGTLEDGEVLGVFQSQEEQEYSLDPITGMKWGYEADNGQTWAQTSPVDAYETIRQYDGNENGKGLAYRFQLPDGTYRVTVGFYDPWKSSDRNMNVTINGETKLSNYVIGASREAKVFEDISAVNGEIIVKAVKAGNSKPMISWIKIEK